MAAPRNALGRGLDALLPPPRWSSLSEDYRICRLEEIHPDPDQPRQHFDESSLRELANSIREKGILQPLVVRPQADGYLLIAGERRFRAAHLADLEAVPVVIKDVASREALELALIENLQREDLNPIEEALAYERLLDTPGMSQQTLAHRLGRNRSTISNTLRLLALGTPLQQMVVDGRLSAGHARALLSLAEPEARQELAERVIAESLSVRQAEAAAKTWEDDGAAPAKRARRQSPLQPWCDTVAQELTESLASPVTIRSRGRKGRLTVEFRGIDQLRALRTALEQIGTLDAHRADS